MSEKYHNPNQDKPGTTRREHLKGIGYTVGLAGLVEAFRRLAVYQHEQLPNYQRDFFKEAAINSDSPAAEQFRYLTREFGEQFIYGTLVGAKKYHESRKDEGQNREVIIADFDKLGFDEKRLRDLLIADKYYPARPLAQISSLKYGDSQGLAATYEDNSIVFNKQQKHTLYSISETLSHELGHACDWLHYKKMPLKDRVEFLYEAFKVYEVTKLEHPGSHAFSRQHTIEKDITDHKIRRLEFLTEWWANLCMDACENPERLSSKQYPREYNLVRKWFVGAENKEFNFTLAKKRRMMALKK